MLEQVKRKYRDLRAVKRQAWQNLHNAESRITGRDIADLGNRACKVGFVVETDGHDEDETDIVPVCCDKFSEVCYCSCVSCKMCRWQGEFIRAAQVYDAAKNVNWLLLKSAFSKVKRDMKNVLEQKYFIYALYSWNRQKYWVAKSDFEWLSRWCTLEMSERFRQMGEVRNRIETLQVRRGILLRELLTR